MKYFDLFIRICVFAMLAEILGIIVFYTTSQEVLSCKVWHHGTYNIAYQRCDAPKKNIMILFQEEKEN